MIHKTSLTPDFDNIEKKLGYRFSDRNLLKTALTHITFANSFNTESNERLEFLGDSVLGLAVTQFLFHNFRDREGTLSTMRSNLVDKENLSKVVSKMGLQKHLIAVEGQPGELRDLSSVQADLFEAVLGAVFLDSNFTTACGWALNKLGIDRVNAQKKVVAKKDSKSQLQELLQHEGKKVKYKLIKQEGKSHEREYTVQVFIDNKGGAVATNTSKKMAEMQVAEQTLRDKGIL